MVKTILGNNTQNLNTQEIKKLALKFDRVHIDLGTGDGRYVFKSAQQNLKTFYIGLEPSEKQLRVYSKKALRSKLKNCIFVVGSVERYPAELHGLATTVTIYLPWGSLLKIWWS